MFLIKKLYTTASNQTINLVYSAEQFNLLWKLQWENEWREIKKKKFFFIKKKGFKKQLNLNSIVENQNLKLKDKKTSFLIKDFSFGYDRGFTKALLAENLKKKFVKSKIK